MKIWNQIVKDLSRFARSHIEAEIYFENIFPALNIRFISIIENIDSYENPESMDNLNVPFKNLLNDAYAKDISKKVRSALLTKRLYVRNGSCTSHIISQNGGVTINFK